MKENPWDTPWKVKNEIMRFLLVPFLKILFWMNGIKWASGWKLNGMPIIQRHRLSTISIGNRMNLRSSAQSNPLSPNHPVVLSTRRKGAQIQIGEDFAMTGGTICADIRIEIGNHVTVGANSIIVDTDFHPISLESRLIEPNTGESCSVIIEDDVFIGANCTILKGVRLGKGCVIGAGSVVVQSIPCFTIAGGIPAKVIRGIDETKQ